MLETQIIPTDPYIYHFLCYTYNTVLWWAPLCKPTPRGHRSSEVEEREWQTQLLRKTHFIGTYKRKLCLEQWDTGPPHCYGSDAELTYHREFKGRIYGKYVFMITSKLF